MVFQKRKSPRLPGYAYDSVNYYFITICSYEKHCIFGKPGELNWIGQCAEKNLLMISQLNPNIRIDKYVIMPNHIHVIIDVQNCRDGIDLTMVIGQYKMSVTKKIGSGYQIFRFSNVRFMIILYEIREAMKKYGII